MLLLTGFANQRQVTKWVRGFNEDGHSFIRSSSRRLASTRHNAKVPIKMSRAKAKALQAQSKPTFRQTPQPKIFSHYVMNLPSTAMDFIPNFIGLYAGQKSLFESSKGNSLPMIHCYCFAEKAETEEEDINVQRDVCARLSTKLGSKVSLDDQDTTIWDVRDVAPNKRQMCASFRLPAEAAFREP